MAALVHPKRTSLSPPACAGEAAPHLRGSPIHAMQEGVALAERSIIRTPEGHVAAAPRYDSVDDESVLMRPSQLPFLRTIKEHKPVRIVTPKRHLLKQGNTISETGLQIVKMTCRDSSTKGALLSVADPAAWAMLSPPRKKTAPDYERWRNRLDYQSAYEPDLSATSHLVSPSEPALSPSMSEISDCTFDGYSSPIPVRSFDAVSPPPPILSEDDISHKSMRDASTVVLRLNRREPPPRRWRKPRVRPHQRAALRAWRGGRLVFEAGRTHGKFERRPLPVAFNFK